MLQNSHQKGIVSKQPSIKSLLTHCRICLASSSTKMIYLYDERPIDHQSIEDATLLEKLNYCSCFSTKAKADDGLPQYICMSCSILIENAYQLKVLCAKTEEKLFELRQLSVVQSENENLGTEQQPKVSTIQIDQIDDTNFNELSKHGHNSRSKENEHKNAKTINAEVEVDIDLMEMENTNGRKQSLSKKAKPKTRKADGNTKAAYQCEQCCKWFYVKTTLAIHMRSHTNERPYACEVGLHILPI